MLQTIKRLLLKIVDDIDAGNSYVDEDEAMQGVVVIGPSSSGDEFVNTLAHEVHHAAVAVAESIGVELVSESPAYITGDTLQSLFGVICDLGCGKCGKRKKTKRSA